MRRRNKVCTTVSLEKSHPETVKSAETAFDVLELLHERNGARLTDLADDLGIAKSTVHRHLATLEKRGYVTAEESVYRTSLRFLDFGERARTRERAYVLAGQKVNQLAEQTNERAQFIVEENGEGVYVHRATGSNAVETDTRIGKRVPLHASAAGLAILAHLPRSRVEEIVTRRGLPRLTTETITDREDLLEECERIRERGFSVNRHGYVMGLSSIGVSVHDRNDQPIGAFSVSGPSHRMKGDWFRTQLPDLILGATNELELKIAYSGASDV
ncbi:IclR family transcriptional regulator [Halegenticoccus tardaugens]|uniref:IclR family transcriptional regulator n=1 Tax=Halegenticoccus tardaugens TaxID=2071624 RepID=UPI00100C2709|nr:IclR family transcriptional regulator [Halegenticoccus tardaugens]